MEGRGRKEGQRCFEGGAREGRTRGGRDEGDRDGKREDKTPTEMGRC